uniref:Neuromedin U n=1 Tax=Cyprinus carpio TaxID=7962 RepID=A0A8C2DR59_CYPCA
MQNSYKCFMLLIFTVLVTLNIIIGIHVIMISAWIAGAPVLLNPSSIEHEQLLTQITDLCSFYLSADPSFRTSDVLEDLCFLMLGSLQKTEVNIIHVRMQSAHTEDFTNILHIIAKPLRICLLNSCAKICLGLVISIVMRRLMKRQFIYYFFFFLYMQEITAREISKRVSV